MRPAPLAGRVHLLAGVGVVLGEVQPRLLDNGGHALLVLAPVLLVQLSGQTVGRAVGVRLVQQRLRQRTAEGGVRTEPARRAGAEASTTQRSATVKTRGNFNPLEPQQLGSWRDHD